MEGFKSGEKVEAKEVSKKVLHDKTLVSKLPEKIRLNKLAQKT